MYACLMKSLILCLVIPGAAVIFGATGGVMEAALRTVAEIVAGKSLENVEIADVEELME